MVGEAGGMSYHEVDTKGTERMWIELPTYITKDGDAIDNGLTEPNG